MEKYAETLFDICKKSNCDALIQEQLNAVKKLYSKVPIFRLILLTKRIQNNDKVDIIKNSLQSFNPIIIEFISIIINGNQTNNMLNIISRFNHLVNVTHAHMTNDQLQIFRYLHVIDWKVDWNFR